MGPGHQTVYQINVCYGRAGEVLDRRLMRAAAPGQRDNSLR